MPTDLGCVVSGAKNQLRCPVVSRANVRDVGLVFHEDFGAAEIAKLQNSTVRVKEKVLWLDVAVANALRMDVSQGPEELVDVELDFENRHRGLHLVEEAGSTVDGLGNELLHQIEIHLVLLLPCQRLTQSVTCVLYCTYALAIRVVECLELDDIGMPNDAHDLQLTVLRFLVSTATSFAATRCGSRRRFAHLETLVLENTLDGGIFVGRGELGLKDDTEGTISYDLALCVLQLLRLAGDAILHLLLDNFCEIESVSGKATDHLQWTMRTAHLPSACY